MGKNKAIREPWYEAKTGSDQGLVVEEKTGKNIAVTYEKKNAELIVTAVNNYQALLEACELACDFINGIENFNDDAEDTLHELRETLKDARRPQ